MLEDQSLFGIMVVQEPGNMNICRFQMKHDTHEGQTDTSYEREIEQTQSKDEYSSNCSYYVSEWKGNLGQNLRSCWRDRC